ncbi:MAG: diphthine--ammonia ligase [Candidatus Woesearchaeota archaeon]
MCGIIGVVNSQKNVELGLKSISYRGLDNQEIVSFDNGCFGHCLHAMNNFVKQPLAHNKSLFVCNSEIYNFEELAKKHGLGVRNDSDLIFQYLLNDFDIDDFDGVYAFAYKKGDELILARDKIGVKPLWYYFDGGEFGFASEKKALLAMGFEKKYVVELNPRKILTYDIKTKKITFIERKYFEVKEKDSKNIKQKLKQLLNESIKKRLSDKKTALLLSGGVDSSYIALKLKQLGVNFKCYVAGMKEPGLKDSEDVLKAKEIAKLLDLDLEVIEISLSQVPGYLKQVLPLIEDNNVVKAGVALPFYLCAKKAKEDGVKLLFSGLGSEEIFAGYERHKNSININEECLAGLRKIYERDLYRDDVITMANNIELRLPFLDKKLVEFALTIPSKYKIADYSKQIFRDISFDEGLPKDFAYRKKKAAQYGSNFDKAIAKLSKKENKNKSEYLKQFFDEGNVRIASLMSTGKDSALSTQIMIDQNYEVSCFITIISKNEDSYMYHGPNTHLAKQISQSSNIPLIVKETKGEKEEELDELKSAIKTAISKYKVEGIVTGALFSNYQRERIEKICEELGVKCFSPLWHMDQEKEMNLLLKRGFKFCMVKVAAYGLDKSWLGKTITSLDIKKLVELNKKYKINIAGEGGEFESLILKAPFMKKEILIKDYELIEENEYTAHIKIKEVELK